MRAPRQPVKFESEQDAVTRTVTAAATTSHMFLNLSPNRNIAVAFVKIRQNKPTNDDFFSPMDVGLPVIIIIRFLIKFVQMYSYL